MNFIRMPGTDVEYGYRVLAVMVVACAALLCASKDWMALTCCRTAVPKSALPRQWLGTWLEPHRRHPRLASCGLQAGHHLRHLNRCPVGLCMRQATDWLEARVRKLDWQGILTLMDFNISGGLLEGRRLVDFFRQRFNDEGIESCPCRLHAWQPNSRQAVRCG